MIEHLNWDSEFFGWKTGSIQLQDISSLSKELEQAKLAGYKLVYVIGNKELNISTNILQHYNGKLVDSKVVFEMQPEHNKTSIAENITEYIDNKVSDDLYQLAFTSGEHSRFKTDKNFKNQEFVRMYRIWLEQSVAKKNADYVYICKQAEDIIAMVTLKIKDKSANIGLIATKTEFQGKGLGKQLIAQCIETAAKNNCQSLTVPTQLNNEQACRFYTASGFQIKSINTIYHFWL